MPSRAGLTLLLLLLLLLLLPLLTVSTSMSMGAADWSCRPGVAGTAQQLVGAVAAAALLAPPSWRWRRDAVPWRPPSAFAVAALPHPVGAVMAV